MMTIRRVLESTVDMWVMVTLLAGLCLANPHRVEAASADDEQTIQQLSQALASVQSLVQQASPYDAVFHRDPTRALVGERGELMTSTGLHDGLSVQGIIWSDQHPLAVVDDELVALGDIVGPYTVTEIKPDGVMAASGTDTIFVPLDRGVTPHEPETTPSTPSPTPSTESAP